VGATPTAPTFLKAIKMTTTKIKIITHFAKDDPRFLTDYIDVEVFINGKLVRSYSDYYHDKGDEKAEAFVDGVVFQLEQFAIRGISIDRIKKADRED
jgi:hypothetical protein